MRTKITVIGAGNVGTTVAHCCLQKKLGDVVLVDTRAEPAKGKALDLTHAAALEQHNCRIMGTADYADTKGSDLVIITAGIARKPGMSRNDLLKTNMGIMRQVAQSAIAQSPDAVFIIVSNPVDILCMTALKATGLTPERIIGLSGTLDSARMCAYIADVAGVPMDSVHGIIMGEHGDGMIPLPRLATIGGVPATNILSPEQMEDVRQKTIAGGASIVGLLGYSAYYAPGIAVAVMAEAIIHDSGAILPCSVYLQGQYGARDMFMCTPAQLNAQGVSRIVELELNSTEKTALSTAIGNISANLKDAEALAKEESIG